MAKRDCLKLSQHQWVETYRDGCGRAFIAYSQGASVFIRDLKELRRFLKIPRSIPMRAALDSWLESLEDMDNIRANKDVPVTDTSTPLSPELLATGFGPEVFQEEEDPTANTRMIT